MIEYDDSAALVLAPSKIPAHTPVIHQNPDSRIVCATISARTNLLLDTEEFAVIIVDEAAQCMEAWIWSLLRPEVHTLVMAGDIQQLPALTSTEGIDLSYGRSLMDRLMTELHYPSHFLATQRRMHPEIVKFVNSSFYDDRLETQYTPCSVSVNPYLVVRVDGVCEQLGTSYVNLREAQACRDIVSRLNEKFDSVVTITPYQGQARELLRLGVERVHTVDSFQGQEADAIVLSMVRDEHIGFWSDPRRLNVALTRAKHCLRIVGNAHRWTGILNSLVEDARHRKRLREAQEEDDDSDGRAQIERIQRIGKKNLSNKNI